MSDTYTKLVYHIVFSTKERAPTITGDIRSTLYEYMGAIIRSKGGSLLEVGGMPDHVHLLARSKANIAVSDLVGSVKANSSRWLNDYPRSASRGARRLFLGSAELRRKGRNYRISWCSTARTYSARSSVRSGCRPSMRRR
ncbi:MAG TPA: IS200/IS605 family transposase [Thermoanaerobaculia bacterium]